MDTLGQFTFLRTYSRDGETWVDVCARVINGMYFLQQQNPTSWDKDKARSSAREAFDMLFHLKWSPPGRGLWIMGTDFIQERLETAALQNCAFISSKFIDTERGDFFRWLMEMSMLGVGVGFDTEGAGKVMIRGPLVYSRKFVIEDNRQGWAESVQALVDCFLDGTHNLEFDYSLIRPAGSLIRSFGGVASGPEPLAKLHMYIRTLLSTRIGQRITSSDIVDVCNMIGECVIAGNVRRSAEIALGKVTDKAFLDLKNYEVVGDSRPWSWVSNNSVVLNSNSKVPISAVERTYNNGEPGYVWLNNIQSYGRMNGLVDERDKDALGVNPCAEQTLHHREMCTLAEIYLPRLGSKHEFARAIKYAYLYAKSVTCGSQFISDETSRSVMENNRRIGLSITGIAQFVSRHGEAKLIEWMKFGYELSGHYDTLYSNWLGLPYSIRRTSIKPSGTVSLLAGVTPGIHFPTANTYIRRINIAENSPIVDRLMAAGYNLEQSKYSTGTLVASFPVSLGTNMPTQREVPVMEQLRLAALASEHYVDNSVSITVMFDRKRDSIEDLRNAVQYASTHLKAVSFLPIDEHGYEQAPYEEITMDTYSNMAGRVKPLDLSGVVSHEMLDAFCDGEACELPAS